MGLSKKDESQIWDTMMARRRRLGPDPEDYPSIRNRMELEYVNVCLIINWLLYKIPIKSDGTLDVAKSGWRHKAVTLIALLILITTTSTTILAALAYRQRGNAELVGQTILSNSHITTQIDASKTTIIVGGELTREGKPTTIVIPTSKSVER